ncbi:MAG: PEP-CTERM sorting domain-containing protein [Planctomycetota bacterium]
MTRITAAITLCVASAMATLGVAQPPSLNLVDNFDGSVTLQIISNENGSVATGLTAVDGGLLGTGDITFTGAFLADPTTFDFEIPGNNPITGTVTEGLYLDSLATNEIFASFGSVILTPGTFDFLTITFTGAGRIDAFGEIAQQGVINNVIASIDVVPEPSTLALAVLGGLGAIRLRRR